MFCGRIYTVADLMGEMCSTRRCSSQMIHLHKFHFADRLPFFYLPFADLQERFWDTPNGTGITPWTRERSARGDTSLAGTHNWLKGRARPPGRIPNTRGREMTRGNRQIRILAGSLTLCRRQRPSQLFVDESILALCRPERRSLLPTRAPQPFAASNSPLAPSAIAFRRVRPRAHPPARHVELRVERRRECAVSRVAAQKGQRKLEANGLWLKILLSNLLE